MLLSLSLPPSVFLASPPGIDFAGQKLVSSDSRTSTQADVTQQLVYIINIPDFLPPSHRMHFYQGDTKTFFMADPPESSGAQRSSWKLETADRA